jgi:hypothetical protein
LVQRKRIFWNGSRSNSSTKTSMDAYRFVIMNPHALRALKSAMARVRQKITESPWDDDLRNIEQRLRKAFHGITVRHAEDASCNFDGDK